MFINEIIKNVPSLQSKIVSIIDASVRRAKRDNEDSVFLLGSEGTVDSGIYQVALLGEGIACHSPSSRELSDVRMCIEDVKQNKVTRDTINLFKDLLAKEETVLLGCTEMSLLLNYCDIQGIKTIDPIKCVMDELYSEYLEAIVKK